MTDQQTLWVDEPRARRLDVQTSHDAAMSAKMAARHHAGLILAALKYKGDAIYTEIAAITGLSPVQVNRRLHELRNFGLVERLKQRRDTPSGRPAFCYRRVT